MLLQKSLVFLSFWFSKSFFFRLMFCTHAGTDIVHPHVIQNQALNLRKCQVCTFHSVSPSPAPIAALFWSYSEWGALSLAVWVRVSVIVGFPLVPVDGEDWSLSSVPGIEGIQAPNHTFPLWDLVPLFCLLLGRSLLFLPFSLWPNSLSEATSSCTETDCMTYCLHRAMECLASPSWALMLLLHCWQIYVGFLVWVSVSLVPSYFPLLGNSHLFDHVWAWAEIGCPCHAPN